MPNPKVRAVESAEISLHEISIDRKNRERTIELSIRNNSSSPLTVLRIEPYLTEGAKLREQRGVSLLALEQQYLAACHKLKILLNDELFFETKALADGRKQYIQSYIDELIGGDWNSILGIIRGVFRIVSRGLTCRLIDRQFVDRFRASTITVNNYQDAIRAFEQIELARAKNDHRNRDISVIWLQLQTLCEIEKAARGSTKSALLVDPNFVYTENFTVIFPASLLESSNNPVSLEITVALGTSQDPIVKRVSMSVQIAAQAWALTLVAISSSILGFGCRFLLSTPSHDLTNAKFWLSQGALSIIVSIFAVNLSESLTLPFKKTINPDWRGAMAVGLASGLAAANVLQGMKGFFSIHTQ